MPPDPTRRAALATLAATPLLALPRRAPALITRDPRRPRLDYGAMAGDVTPDGAMLWTRVDRPAELRVEYGADPRFTAPTRLDGARALPETDHTAKIALPAPPPGAEVHYRITARDPRTGAWSAPAVGRFRAPSTKPERVTFAWGGDTCGQGYGIDPRIGRIAIHDHIRRHRPDVFIHSGDLIYADGPLRPQKTLADGTVWHNIVTPEKAKVAETLAEFRGNFRYTHLDPAWRALIADTALVVQWDDHETKNNWWPGRVLRDARYTERRCDVLAARARQAFFEYTPIAARPEAPGRIYRHLRRGPLLDIFVLDARSHRSPNGPNTEPEPGPDTAFFGEPQLDWLSRALATSTATWKIIASDQPLSLVINHATTGNEGLANGRSGPPLGREHELARLLAHLKARKIRNVVFLTADVHYAAAHRFDPQRAAFTDFDPFWEFVAGPLHAGTFGPNPHDPTFGPVTEFLSLPPGSPPGRPPSDGLQFYGTGAIDPTTRRLTVDLHRANGQRIHREILDPA